MASNHHFQRTPDGRELQERMRYMNDCGADILKMAVMPIDSLSTLFDFRSHDSYETGM